MSSGYDVIVIGGGSRAGYGLADSPASQAAWMYDNFVAWTYGGESF